MNHYIDFSLNSISIVGGQNYFLVLNPGIEFVLDVIMLIKGFS